MSDHIWIVRDPSGHVIGASAIDAYCAADEFGGRDSVALSYAIDNQPGPTYTANGYTLTREPLTPAPRVVVLDEWRVVDQRGHHATYHPFALRTDEWWHGRMRPATDAEILAVFSPTPPQDAATTRGEG